MPVKAPPLLVSFTYPELYLKSLPESVLTLYQNEICRLIENGLPPVVSIRSLAVLFGLSSSFVGALYKNPEKYYRVFEIRKGRKTRVIQAPKVALKVIQKWFGTHLGDSIVLDDAIFGFVKGRSSAKAAARHCNAKWVFSIDIENFFQSTPIQMVEQELVRVGYSQHGAEVISKLCTYNGKLSQGSPASPVLSNLVFRQADKELIALASYYRIRYTRYADDIVFSGTDEFPEDIRDKSISIIQSYGWTISENKTFFASSPQRLKVHGLLVHRDNPRLTKGYRNRIRAYKHLIAMGKVREPDILILKGHISYAKSVEDVRSE